MLCNQNRPAENEAPDDIYETLALANPRDKTAIVLQCIEAHPQGRLVLPARHGVPCILNEVDLSRQTLAARLSQGRDHDLLWWSTEASGARLCLANLQGASLRLANLEGADLRGADLQGASLGAANLQDSLLEEANLQAADLASANLRKALLGEANLHRAMLEDADLQQSVLRFANLQGAVLEGAHLAGADLWGANLEHADMEEANLQGARLEEANMRGANLMGVNLQQARLAKANLQQANLARADLQGAVLTGADLQGAILRHAKLQGIILTDCNLTHAHVSGAWLDRTHLHVEQIGGAIGEELIGDYKEASLGYLALERNFEDLGSVDAASWAYRKRRRMQKLEARWQARLARQQRQWRAAVHHYTKYASDQFVEWLCDYGESIRRVLSSLLLVYVLFTLIYLLTGGIVRVQETPAGVIKVPTHRLSDAAIFSLIAMASPDGAPVGLLQRNALIHVLTGVETLLCIALTGLLGFVLGNRIRR